MLTLPLMLALLDKLWRWNFIFALPSDWTHRLLSTFIISSCELWSASIAKISPSTVIVGYIIYHMTNVIIDDSDVRSEGMRFCLLFIGWRGDMEICKVCGSLKVRSRLKATSFLMCLREVVEASFSYIFAAGALLKKELCPCWFCLLVLGSGTAWEGVLRLPAIRARLELFLSCTWKKSAARNFKARLNWSRFFLDFMENIFIILMPSFSFLICVMGHILKRRTLLSTRLSEFFQSIF